MKNKCVKDKQRQRLFAFIKDDIALLVLFALSGTLFNVGLVFIPVFEGWLVQCLYDIIGGSKVYADMIRLVLFYLLAMLVVQVTRYLKRFYVRKIANNMVVRMRDRLYNTIVNTPTTTLNGNVGELVIRATSDIEIVAEGTRKTLTEIFDTGVLLISYAVVLYIYDPIIASIALIFTPIACFIAEILKKLIFKQVSEYKLSAENLSNSIYDRVSNVRLYRLNGRDSDKNEQFKQELRDYEGKAIRANIWENTLQPVYNVIAMIGVIFIIYLGARNCLGVGYRVWDIAALTTVVACYAKISDKASKVARLVNSIQKAEVSWHRLKDKLYAEDNAAQDEKTSVKPVYMSVNNLKFAYPDGKEIITDSSFSAQSGQIIGITGQIASGKSTLLKVFLSEHPYLGSIEINGKELSSFSDKERNDIITYLGHEPELYSFSIKENVELGENVDVNKFLKIVEIDGEIAEMNQGVETATGNLGVRLSGGQQSRIALARTLAHARSIILLDDPFSAVDRKTERKIFENIKNAFADRLIVIVSHRLEIFEQFDKVLWLEDKKVLESTHKELLAKNCTYRELYELQKESCHE